MLARPLPACDDPGEVRSRCAGGQLLNLLEKTGWSGALTPTPALTATDLGDQALARKHIPERGVYAIECTDGRSYIGASERVGHRWGQHGSDLRLGKSKNRPMQEAYDCLGSGAFNYKLLELVPEGDLTQAEQKWMDLAKGCLFNAAPSAGTVKGLVHTAESRARQSVSQQARCADPSEFARRSSVRVGLVTGEKHPAAKLKAADVLEVRRLRASGLRLREISERFGISVSAVSRIALGQSWTTV